MGSEHQRREKLYLANYHGDVLGGWMQHCSWMQFLGVVRWKTCLTVSQAKGKSNLHPGLSQTNQEVTCMLSAFHWETNSRMINIMIRCQPSCLSRCSHSLSSTIHLKKISLSSTIHFKKISSFMPHVCPKAK